MSSLELPKLYAITDARLSGRTHAEQVARLVEGGARLIQLREKHLSPREFCREAEAALKVARDAGATLVVNDRVDIALVVGADGVHLGQDDLSPEHARSLLGRAAVVGYSTHNVAQATEAARLPVTYVAIGPVFDTTSKENPEQTIGLEGVRRARAVVGATPLVAIGGITLENAASVLEAGADCVAVIGALVAPARDPADITRRTREMLASLSLH
ncbi:MAG TPA: thiamine phosphate synthase [Pyrinomonadaceae bacterium]|nr:thiamine phosphate synthase [Pyrinomonadaceae bacterium]